MQRSNVGFVGRTATRNALTHLTTRASPSQTALKKSQGITYPDLRPPCAGKSDRKVGMMGREIRRSSFSSQEMQDLEIPMYILFRFVIKLLISRIHENIALYRSERELALHPFVRVAGRAGGRPGRAVLHPPVRHLQHPRRVLHVQVQGRMQRRQRDASGVRRHLPDLIRAGAHVLKATEEIAVMESERQSHSTFVFIFTIR